MEPSTEAIPSWDGNPGGWLRYTLQVSWFVLGTKKSVRPVEAPRLIGQLTLEFLPWTMCDFKGKDGIRVLASPEDPSIY